MSLHYSKEEYLEIEQKLNNNRFKEFQEVDNDAPESELAKNIRSHCKDNGLPCLIFPQTPDVKRFLPKGWPDVEIIVRGQLPLYFELKKVKGGRKSKAQKDMATMFAYLGNPIYECRTYKRFIELLYGKTRQQPTPDVYVRGVKWTEEI